MPIFATRHNGGRSQVNLNFITDSGDYPFLNLMKSGAGWLGTPGGGPPAPNTLDSNGYPSTLPRSVYMRIVIPSQTARPGNYVLKWDGNGTVFFIVGGTALPSVSFTGSVTSGTMIAGTPSTTISKGMTLSTGGRVGDQLSGTPGGAGTYSTIGAPNAASQTITLSGGSTTSSTGSGRYVYSTADTAQIIGISAIGTPAITNMVLCHVDDEARLEAGEVFGVQFKAKLQEANFGVIRFLNWMVTNTNPIANWADRRPASYYCYGAAHFRSDLYCTSSAALSGSAFAVGAPPGWSGLRDKAQVILKFNSATTGSSYTLNVGASGAITLLDPDASPLGTSYPAIAADIYALCTYDATLNAWIKQGGYTDNDMAGLDNGVPPELMLQLCAELGAHPWFPCPAYSLDPVPADSYTKGFANYNVANAPSWMIPRYEPVNEIWNPGYHFYFTTFASKKAQAYWGSSYTFQDWYGKVASVMGQLISSVYGADRTKYQMIFGVQTVTGDSMSSTTANTDRIQSTQYRLQAAAAQSPYIKDYAYNWVTHLCAANYFSPGMEYQQIETDLAARYAASTNAQEKQNMLDEYALSALYPEASSPYADCQAKIIRYLTNLKAFAQSYGVNNMTLYEGSYDPFFSYSGVPSDINRLRDDSILSPTVYSTTLALYVAILRLSDSNFTVEFPSMFTFSQSADSQATRQEWYLLCDVYQPNTPQFNAIKAFNNGARTRSLRRRF